MPFDVGGIRFTSPGGTTLSVDGAVNFMQVNASGIVTRPQAPYMRGQLSGKGGSPYNNGGNALLVTADVNRGSCWNNATGNFTCPVPGYYMATMGGICGPAGYGYPRIRKNGGDYVFGHWNHAANWHYVSLSAIVLCSAGDTIHFAIQAGSPANAGIYGEGGHQMFSIALMA